MEKNLEELNLVMTKEDVKKTLEELKKLPEITEDNSFKIDSYDLFVKKED